MLPLHAPLHEGSQLAYPLSSIYLGGGPFTRSALFKQKNPATLRATPAVPCTGRWGETALPDKVALSDDLPFLSAIATESLTNKLIEMHDGNPGEQESHREQVASLNFCLF